MLTLRGIIEEMRLEIRKGVKMPGHGVKTGAQQIFEQSESLPFGVKIGLIANPTAITHEFIHLADALIDREDVEVTALFGPEHGLFATAQDQIGVTQTTYRGVPVHSLYGDSPQSLYPKKEDVAQCDLILFDIQDVGSRYYTYVWTMTGAMEICALAGVPFWVLDRPNPIGGEILEGPVLKPQFASFVGKMPLPTRHGMTAGEIALMANDYQDTPCDLTVVRCSGWKRELWFDQCHLPWVMPSPNMPTLDTAIVYPGGCLIEGTNLSEGRGTTRPFELVGAPFLDGREMAARLNRRDLPGVHFRYAVFEPAFHKHVKKQCQGVFVHVTDRWAFRSVETYTALIIEARRLAPTFFDWRREPYEFENDRLAIDLLYGTDAVRTAIEEGASLNDITRPWDAMDDAFMDHRNRFLLYD